jgi:hypothetical protein
MILSSGLDSIYLSLSVTLINSEKVYSYLSDLKNKSCELDEEQVGSFDGQYYFKVKKTGRRGYEYVMDSNEYSICLMKTEKLGMPNILIEVRSEKLWSIGLQESVKESIKIIQDISKKIDWVKVSRIDLCADMIMKKNDWNLEILNKMVTRARKSDTHHEKGELTGLSIGGGSIMLRIYDKEREIKKSNKLWFYEVWKIKEDELPEDNLIIRVEYQIRSDVLRAFEIVEVGDVYSVLNALWSYLTREWFKILVEKGSSQRHKDYQEIEPYWQLIQNVTFNDEYKEIERIKDVIYEMDRKKITKDIINKLALLMSVEIYICELSRKPFTAWNYKDAIIVLEREIPRIIEEDEFSEMIKKRLIKYDRVNKYTDEVPF